MVPINVHVIRCDIWYNMIMSLDLRCLPMFERRYLYRFKWNSMLIERINKWYELTITRCSTNVIIYMYYMI